jgi:hypothetical protein
MKTITILHVELQISLTNKQEFVTLERGFLYWFIVFYFGNKETVYYYLAHVTTDNAAIKS